MKRDYPHPGTKSNPHMDTCIRDNGRMGKGSVRQILAANLERLMMRTPGMETQPAVAKRAAMGQSTVSRLLRSEQGATVDMLESLARAFGVQAWELLVDDEGTRQAALQRMILGPRDGPHAIDERAADHGEQSPDPGHSTAGKRKRPRKNPPLT